MQKLSLKKSTVQVKIIIVVFFLIFSALAFVHIYPLLWAIINSLKSGVEYFDDSFALPKVWQFGNYLKVFTEFKVRDFYYMDMLFNSIWMLVVSVLANVASSAILAYPLARFDFPGKNLLYSIVIFANVIPIIGSGPANYKMLNALGMINNPWTIWLSWKKKLFCPFLLSTASVMRK